jgi:hypothetical protein
MRRGRLAPSGAAAALARERTAGGEGRRRGGQVRDAADGHEAMEGSHSAAGDDGLLHALFCAISMAMGFCFSHLIVYLLFLPTLLINPVFHLHGANGAVSYVPDLIPDKAKTGNPTDDCSTRDAPKPFAGHRYSEKQPGSATFPDP